MAYSLGEIILPSPDKLTRDFIETSASNIVIHGETTKRVENRKERYTLEFSFLTTTQVNNILSEYELNLVRTFTVDETNLSIGPTDVLINISGRNYPPTGKIYKENLIIILTEVL